MKLSKRHLAKSLSWRLIGSLDTLVFAWLITGDFKEGLGISGITTLTKLVWYYVHERWWFNSSIADSNKRHIIKSFMWRGIGTLDTIFFSWILTGNPLVGFKIGGVETVSKIILYFGHEKLWYRINYVLDKRNRRKRLKIQLEERSKINK
jgi:uncharacterized membrane protein